MVFGILAAIKIFHHAGKAGLKFEICQKCEYSVWNISITEGIYVLDK